MMRSTTHRQDGRTHDSSGGNRGSGWRAHGQQAGPGQSGPKLLRPHPRNHNTLRPPQWLCQIRLSS